MLLVAVVSLSMLLCLVSIRLLSFVFAVPAASGCKIEYFAAVMSALHCLPTHPACGMRMARCRHQAPLHLTIGIVVYLRSPFYKHMITGCCRGPKTHWRSPGQLDAAYLLPLPLGRSPQRAVEPRKVVEVRNIVLATFDSLGTGQTLTHTGVCTFWLSWVAVAVGQHPHGAPHMSAPGHRQPFGMTACNNCLGCIQVVGCFFGRLQGLSGAVLCVRPVHEAASAPERHIQRHSSLDI